MQLALEFEMRQVNEMTESEEAVYDILCRHKGKEAAITQHRLAELTNMHPRKARKIIKNIIEVHQIQIASSYEGKDGGYYIPITEEEIKETEDKLYGHALSILKRLSVFRKIDFLKLQKELF